MIKNKLEFKFVRNKIYSFVKRNSTEIFCVFCFILANFTLLIYLYPFNQPIMGHDYRYHYLRVEALKYNIENNNLFSGIDYKFFGGGGYASFAYPEIFLYIPAVLRVLGVGIGDSMSFFLNLCNVLSYYFMFIFLKKISRSPICGTIGAVLYVLSTYRLDNIITRFALGEIQAYVFWPLILYGLYDFIFDDFKKPHIIGIGFAGMLLSHSISTALALGLSVLFSLIFIKRIFQTPKKLLTLSITAGCTVLVTAFYWIPLLELLFSCEMSVKIPAYHTVNYAVPFVGLFQDNMHNGIAGMRLPIFLLGVPRVFLTRKSPITKKYLFDEKTQSSKNVLVAADTFMIIGIVLSLMSTTLVPWQFLSVFLDFMQFPWRFFAPASLLIITAGTIYLFYVIRYTKVPEMATVFIVGVAILLSGVHAEISGIGHNNEIDDNFFSNANETYHIGCGEWLPRAAQGDGINSLRQMGDNVLLSSDESVSCVRKNGSLEFNLTGYSGIKSATLPYVWYKGYTAKDGNGKELEISMSENGLVQVDLRGASGIISVEHNPTSLKIASYFISVVSITILIVLPLLRMKKRIPTEGNAE